ncbi:HAT transposon superfamily protein [Hirschfeldia incana]|nr:HAT transposon superfamily protein [Hirschfeldia incana]
MDIHEHGVWVNKKRKRVRCNYCGKEISGFQRLKCHLAGVVRVITPCGQVPSTVRESFRKVVAEEKDKLTADKSKSDGGVQLANNAHKRGRSQDSSGESVEANKLVLLANKSQEWIGQCSSYASSLDFSAVEFSCFREMMMNAGDGTIRDFHDLKGRMFQEALVEVGEYVKKIKDSWAVTGCSILLEAWVDSKGRDLATFVADCPAGPVYLTSLDVSEIKHDSNALISLVDGLVDEVGVHNVVQIVASSASGWVGELGESYAGNKKGVFWSVSVSHCFELMLLKIGDIDSLGYIVDAVNMITDFINNNPLALKFVRDQDQSLSIDMTASSEFEFFLPYLTLESIFRVKSDLAAMFALSDCNNEEDVRVSKLVNDAAFWKIVERTLKCTSPLIHGLLWFSKAKNQHVGNIYETMDVIKESIAREFNNEESCYEPLWDVIDEVWNEHLHSPLHAAGYYLNPSTFYSDDFHLDSEVAVGLGSSLVHVVKESDIQVKVVTQLDIYRVGDDCFNEASQADQISGITPAEWWAQKVRKHPELQSFAIKVLSQTCEGASRYMLKSKLAEKLVLTEGMTSSEQERLEDLAFVHYNLHLKSCKAKPSEEQ